MYRNWGDCISEGCDNICSVAWIFYFKRQQQQQLGGAKNNLFREHDLTEVAVGNVGTYTKENQR